jgi:hypothetical protein
MSDPRFTPPEAPLASAPADWRNDPDLSDNWKFRFDFFEKHGVPGFAGPSKEFSQAIKALPYGDKLKIGINFFAFFFGAIYYAFFLKLWRQALILIGVAVVGGLVVAIFNLGSSAMTGLNVALMLTYGFRANALYYLQRTKGDIGWNL